MERASCNSGELRSWKPSALEKTPRQMITKCVAGKISPTKRIPPSRDDTGSIIPENCLAGMIVAIDVAKIAVIWLRVKADIKRPRPVEAVIKSSAAKVQSRKLPLRGTSKAKTASAQTRKKFTMPKAI